MSDYSFSSDGMSSDDDRDSLVSEISAFHSDSENENVSEGADVDVGEDAPIAATTRSSRRRSARISSEPQLQRAPKIVVVDDSEASDYEEVADVPPPRRKSRSRSRRKHRTSRIRRTLPLAMVPEDVPWKPAQFEIEEDPDTVENSPSVAFIIIFINTFSDIFADLPPYGPQDIERGVKEHTPEIELLFLRLLGLVLNRKKEIESGRYSSALSELHALLPILGVGLQFPLIDWKSKTAFHDLRWDDRLEFLHVLVHWTLANSERVRYYLASLDDASTMPWLGTDNDNCRYYLVHGISDQENRDTEFRVYKETNRLLSYVSWRAVAGTPAEVAKLASALEPQGKAAGKLGKKLSALVAELELAEDRRYKELRRQRRRHDIEQQAMQVLQGEGKYSGRTRGKRVDYSQLSYDRELDDAMRRPTRKSARVDEAWVEQPAAPAVPMGDRQSRRLRGELTMDIEKIEQELEAAEARGRKRGREQAEREREEAERKEKEEQERLLKEELERKEKEARELQEREQERELQEQQLKEQQLKEQQLKEQELQEQKLPERLQEPAQREPYQAPQNAHLQAPQATHASQPNHSAAQVQSQSPVQAAQAAQEAQPSPQNQSPAVQSTQASPQFGLPSINQMHQGVMNLPGQISMGLMGQMPSPGQAPAMPGQMMGHMSPGQMGPAQMAQMSAGQMGQMSAGQMGQMAPNQMPPIMPGQMNQMGQVNQYYPGMQMPQMQYYQYPYPPNPESGGPKGA